MMLFLLLLLSAFAPPAAPASVAGSWTVATDVQGNTGTSNCTFKQETGKLTGTCTSSQGTASEVTGEVADKKVTFRYIVEWEGSPLTLVFAGTLDTDTTMSGTLEVQPLGVSGDFSAKRQK